MKFSKAKSLLTLMLLAVFALAGCKTVEPWERGAHSGYGMRKDRDPLAEHLAEHTFFTREATAGGVGVGGGGCGCN